MILELSVLCLSSRMDFMALYSLKRESETDIARILTS